MVNKNGLSDQSLQEMTTLLSTWIKENLTGENVGDLIQIISQFKEQGFPYQEFRDLYDLLYQLNLELLNLFDHFLCYTGSGDETQMTRSSRLACTKAVTHLKAKRHTLGLVTEKLLVEAGDKLCALYWEENREISRHEQEIVYQIARGILNAYQEKMTSYCRHGVRDVEALHVQLLHHCITMMNRCLDFASKMSNVHSEANEILEASLENTFLELKSKHGISERSTTNPASTVEVLYIEPQPEKSKLKKENEVMSQNIVTPTPVNKVQVSILGYKTIMDSQWSSITDHVTLWNLHDKTVTMVTANLTAEEKNDASIEMKYYFSFLSEVLEESRGISGPEEKCLCINFASSGIEFGVHANGSNNGNFGEHWIFDPASSSACTTLKFKGKLFIDILIDFLLMQGGSKKNKQREKIIGIFKRIWQEGEKVTGKLGQAIIAIPTWFNLEHIADLRDLAHESGFKIASFLRESSLAMYSTIWQSADLHPNLVIGITVGVTGVYVEAISRDSYNVIKLLTVAQYEWDFEDLSNSGKNKNQLCFQGSSRFQNPRLAMGSQKNSLDILFMTFDKAFAQLEDYHRQQKLYCFLLSDSHVWKQSYKTFLKFRTFQVTDLGGLEQHFALKGSIRLSKNVSRIRSIIVDHPIT